MHRSLLLCTVQLYLASPYGYAGGRFKRDFAGLPLASVRLPLPSAATHGAYNISATAMRSIQMLNEQDLKLYADAERLFEQQLREYKV